MTSERYQRLPETGRFGPSRSHRPRKVCERPATAAGITFVNLEDETGLINVVCSRGCWARFRRVVRSCPALLIRGRLEKQEGVINVVAERIDPLPVGAPIRSRDFR